VKKFLIAILAVLYLGSSTGATVYMHYCMGELSGSGLGYDESQSCGKCGMEKCADDDNGCCKDEQKFIKNADDQKTIPVSFSELPTIDFLTITVENPLSNSPPRRQAQPIYLLNRNFRI
jgi:hypothetical protein